MSSRLGGEVVQPRCAGRVRLYRYADDMVVCCQYERDAQRILRALEKRLALNADKTALTTR